MDIGSGREAAVDGARQTARVTDTETADTDDVGRAPAPGPRPWWRSTAFLLLLGGVAPRFGFFFTGLIAMALLLGDATRQRDVRAGGAVVVLYWTWVWTFAGIQPPIAFVLLTIAAVFFFRATRALRSEHARSWWWTATATLATAAFAVLNLVPYGVRQAELSKTDALKRTADAQAADRRIAATRAAVYAVRNRLTQRPLYIVVLFEPNTTQPTTGDGEPCFRRLERVQVDGISGDLDRLGVVEAAAADGNCLRVKVGTRLELLPVPAAG